MPRGLVRTLPHFCTCVDFVGVGFCEPLELEAQAAIPALITATSSPMLSTASTLFKRLCHRWYRCSICNISYPPRVSLQSTLYRDKTLPTVKSSRVGLARYKRELSSQKVAIRDSRLY